MAEPLFTDRALQDAYRALMKDGAAGGHLDEATWDRIAGGEIDPSARDQAFDHVVECAACSRVWRGILALKSEAETQGLIAADVPPATLWRSRYMPLAIAATLVLAAAGVMLTRQPAPESETVRSTSALPAIDGLMSASDADGAPVFIWTPVAGATRYRVEIFSDDGRPLWSGEMTAPPMRWPEALPKTKGAYRWRVEALGDESAVARSRLTPLEIAR